MNQQGQPRRHDWGGDGKKVAIGEALEATAATAGNKPVDASDAAAIQAAEAIATGINAISGGVAATASAAAAANASVDRDEDKTKLGQVVADASMRLMDKKATREDAERVAAAEMRNNPDLRTYPGGVGASILAAAKLNQDR
ncbi:late embryogenesis abundant protein D-34-like [Curcuma longa]|uniref:late embryogenesis abundant protein D-34-like n=1 Tax=Curcuma longa TaxID=136217 RepID=UPI003D9DC688